MWAFLKFIVYMFSYFDLWSPYFIPVCPNLNTLKSIMEKYRYKYHKAGNTCQILQMLRPQTFMYRPFVL